MGGNSKKDNLVLLTAREHYLAHYLLYKIYQNKEMSSALWFMSNKNDYRIFSSKMYEKLREEIIEYNSGENNFSFERYPKEAAAVTKKKVICLNDMKVFESLKECAEFYDLNYGKLSSVLRGERNQTFNKQFSFYEEGKEYSLKELKDRKHKKVICVETKQIFNSCKEAANFCNLKDASSISRCCKNKLKTAGNLHWEYLDKENETYHREIDQGTRVICVEENKEFRSLKAAVIWAKLNHNYDIVKCCKDKEKTAGGYHWKYADENN
jgi:hypothetical protein